jgi:hypothetical protein
MKYIVTCRPVAGQRIGKHIPANKYAGNYRITFIDMQHDVNKTIEEEAFSV